MEDRVALGNGLTYRMRGAFCEFDDSGKRRFIEIHFIYYDEAHVKRLQEIDCLEDSLLYTFMSLIDTPIHPNTRFLYKLKTYHAGAQTDDAYTFNNSITDYKQLGFTDIDSLLTFCETEWNLTEADFKPQYETAIP